MRTWRTCSRWLRVGGLCIGATVASVGCIGPQEELAEPMGFQEESLGGTVSSFEDVLAPYGEWIDLADVGRVWRPHASVVGADFVPYATGGQWRYGQDIGWTFETAWAWGWVPFHYGRWVFVSGYGWVWWPDTVWGAAWVSWRFGGGFIGWSPLPPPFITVDPFWCFTGVSDFVRPYVGRYLVPRYRVGVVFHDTVTVGEPWRWHHPWHPGPLPEFVEHYTGHPPPPATLPPQPILPIPGVTTPRPPRPVDVAPVPGSSLPPVEATPVLPTAPPTEVVPPSSVEATPVLPTPPPTQVAPPPPVEATPVLPTHPPTQVVPPPSVEPTPVAPAPPASPPTVAPAPPPVEATPVLPTPPPPAQVAPPPPSAPPSAPQPTEPAPPPAAPAPAPPPAAPAPAPPVTPRPPPANPP